MTQGSLETPGADEWNRSWQREVLCQIRRSLPEYCHCQQRQEGICLQLIREGLGIQGRTWLAGAR